MEIWFWQDKKAEIALILFLTLGFTVLFVSGSWYCQIQTTIYFSDQIGIKYMEKEIIPLVVFRYNKFDEFL